MKLFLVNVLLALVWIALTGKFNAENLGLGLLAGFIVIALTSRIWGEKPYAQKAWYIIKFLLFIILEIIVSSIKIAFDVVRPTLKARPGVIAIPLEKDTNLEITILATLISLTPGTLTLDVSSDKKTLFVHSMFAGDVDTLRKNIKETLEKPILRILE